MGKPMKAILERENLLQLWFGEQSLLLNRHLLTFKVTRLLPYHRRLVDVTSSHSMMANRDMV